MPLTLTRVPLPDEPPSDRAYQVAESGRVWRVRVTEREIESSVASVMNNQAGKPIFREFALQLSAALLGPDGQVAADPTGRLIIMEVETWTVPLVSLHSANYNPDEMAADAIRDLIGKGEIWVQNIAASAEFLGRWKSGAPAGPELPAAL